MYLSDHSVKVAAELIYVEALASGEEDARGILTGKPALAQIVKGAVLLGCRGQVILILLNIGVGVYLIKYKVYWLIARADILQGLLNNIELILKLRV